jgi:hypothetical protein
MVAGDGEVNGPNSGCDGVVSEEGEGRVGRRAVRVHAWTHNVQGRHALDIRALFVVPIQSPRSCAGVMVGETVAFFHLRQRWP